VDESCIVAADIPRLAGKVDGINIKLAKCGSLREALRMIATARTTMPKAKVRLSAGRTELTFSDQALCFLAGANSIFAGEKLLTTPNPDYDMDRRLFETLGLKVLTSDPDGPHAIPETA